MTNDASMDENPDLLPRSRIKVDFAILDAQTKRTIHAVLESVHPEKHWSLQFDEDTEANRTHRLWPIHS